MGRRWLTRIAVVGGVLTGVLLLALVTGSRKREALWRHEALECTAAAVVQYAHEHARLPVSVTELIASGYITQQPTGRAACAGGVSSPPWEHVLSVQLDLPPTEEGLQIQEDRLIEKSTGKERFLLTFAGGRMSEQELRQVTVWMFSQLTGHGPVATPRLLAGGTTQEGGGEMVRSSATVPASDGGPGPGCSQVAADWLAPGVVLCRVSQDAFVDGPADRWMPRDCALPLGSSGHPPQVFERMALQDGHELLPLNWPSDLRGKVLIRNAEDALAFVRLFSAAESWHCFPEFGYLELTAGTPRPLITGGIDEQAFRSLGLEAPEVVPYKDGFRVRRAVAKVLRFTPVTVSTIDEMVLRDGTYALRVLCSRAIPEGDTRVLVHRAQ